MFFSDGDRREYLNFLKAEALKNGVEIWAWCLMDNHVHFVAVPSTEEGLAKSFGDAHKRYTRMINFREKWRGYLWQGRFSSFPMDEAYVFSAVRYMERNPVEAGLVQKAEDYVWSSARAHVYGISDPLLSPNFMTEQIGDWSEYLSKPCDDEVEAFKGHVKTGRPFGDGNFLSKLEELTGRVLKKAKPGRKPLAIK